MSVSTLTHTTWNLHANACARTTNRCVRRKSLKTAPPIQHDALPQPGGQVVDLFLLSTAGPTPFSGKEVPMTSKLSLYENFTLQFIRAADLSICGDRGIFP